MNPISDQVEPFALDEMDAPQDGWDDPVRGRASLAHLVFPRGDPVEGIDLRGGRISARRMAGLPQSRRLDPMLPDLPLGADRSLAKSITSTDGSSPPCHTSRHTPRSSL